MRFNDRASGSWPTDSAVYFMNTVNGIQRVDELTFIETLYSDAW